MLSLKNFFSGTSLISDGTFTTGTYVTIDISMGPVSDVARTLFFYTESIDYDVNFTRNGNMSLRLLDASTLRASWWNVYGQDVTRSVNWWVMEFYEGVITQHYYSSLKPSSPITIGAVDTSRSFIIPSWAIYDSYEGSSTWNYTGANFRFTDNTSVAMANDGTKLRDVSMQIVQWDGAYAQHSLTTIDTTTNKDVTINSVDMARAVLFSSNNWTSSVDNPTSVDQYARCFLNTDTAVRLNVDATGYPQEIAASVVTIPQFSVQRGLTTLGDVTSSNATMNSVNLTNAVAWVSMPNRPFSQRNEPTEPKIHPGAHATLLTFNDSTQFNITRGRPWSGIDIDWQILEFQSPPPRHGFVLYQDPGIF